MAWKHRNKLALLASASAALLIQGSGIPIKDHQKTTLHVKDEKKKISLAKDAINRFMIKHGIPGLSFGVTIDSKRVFSGGSGLADVETGGLCTEDTVMRIASISKPITATVAALLVSEKKLDLDAPINEYLKDFPKKKYESKDVTITTRQLLSHTGGIRHYPKNETDENNNDSTEKKKPKKNEFLLNEEFSSVGEALNIFKNDPLVAEPGQKYSYTTHGYTLVSAVLEEVSGKTFPEMLLALFTKLGMKHTTLDRNGRITFHRAKYYHRNEQHHLENCPEVNNSYKWAGGGIQSRVGDLLKLAHAYLYSYQCPENGFTEPPLLPRKILDQFWKGEILASPMKDQYVGLGWFRVEGTGPIGGISENRACWYHTGGAVGASSILLIAPKGTLHKDGTPQGICIAMLCNLQSVDLSPLAMELKEIFEEN